MVVRVDIGTYTRGYKWFQYQVLEPGSSIDPYSLKTFNFQCFHTKLGKFKSCLIWAEEGSRLSSVLSDGNDVKANNCKFKICIYPSIENHWNNFAKFLNLKIVRTLPELLLSLPQASGFQTNFMNFVSEIDHTAACFLQFLLSHGTTGVSAILHRIRIGYVKCYVNYINIG